MSDIRPFQGLRYARDPQTRIAPPYDVIYDDDRARLAADPENVVHLTLPPGKEGARDYAAARLTLQRWIQNKTLVRDAQPRLYVLEERTTDSRLRRGFLSLVRLADYSERVLLPHERTMAGPKRDRLLLTREVRANLEPLFFLYEDRDDKLVEIFDAAARTDCLVSCDGPDGTALRLYALGDAARIEAARAFLADRSLIIADGHHRYETMLRYRDECREQARQEGRAPGRDEPHEFVMAYVVNAFDPGSRIQAIHRMLSGKHNDPVSVAERAGFALEKLANEPAEALIVRLETLRRASHAFVLARPDGSLLLARRKRGELLDVQVLHDDLLPALGGELSFDAQPARLLASVRGGGASLAILMNPTSADELFRVVQAGAVLPQKSTFFSPKIPSGLVIRDF